MAESVEDEHYFYREFLQTQVPRDNELSRNEDHLVLPMRNLIVGIDLEDFHLKTHAECKIVVEQNSQLLIESWQEWLSKGNSFESRPHPTLAKKLA